jgi:hypothetical protein
MLIDAYSDWLVYTHQLAYTVNRLIDYFYMIGWCICCFLLVGVYAKCCHSNWLVYVLIYGHSDWLFIIYADRDTFCLGMLYAD